MRCEELRMRPLEYVSPDDTVQLAALNMRDANIGFLSVCGADRTVAGVLTDRDLTPRVLAEGRSGSTRVNEVMTSEDLVTCQADDELEVPERLMREHGVGRVVVIDRQGHAVGVASIADIVRYQSEDEGVSTMIDVTEREVEEPWS